MDNPLRNGLWNVLYELYFSHGVHRNTLSSAVFYPLWKTIWRDFFKATLDALPFGFSGAQEELRVWFFAAPWHGVYDFIEFVAQTGTSSARGQGQLEREVNAI